MQMGVDMKYLILTATLISLAGCSSSPMQDTPASVTGSSFRNYHSPTSSVALVYNYFQHKNYSLSEQQQSKQTTAVYAALESEYGQKFNWYEKNAKGTVKAVHGYPQGSGFCKVIYSSITVNYNTKNFEETACQESGHNGWRFVYKPR